MSFLAVAGATRILNPRVGSDSICSALLFSKIGGVAFVRGREPGTAEASKADM